MVNFLEDRRTELAKNAIQGKLSPYLVRLNASQKYFEKGKFVINAESR